LQGQSILHGLGGANPCVFGHTLGLDEFAGQGLVGIRAADQSKSGLFFCAYKLGHDLGLAQVGEFACLRVKEINPRIGAFLDWGLPKDLLLPFREQGAPLRAGQQVVVVVCLDPKTDRIIASARLNRHLSNEMPDYREGDPVRFIITGKTPLGYNAIVENAHPGLLYHSNLSAPLTTGQVLNGFVRAIREGGKLDLSLDASGYQRVASLTEQIEQALEHSGGRLDFDDDSSPEQIREAFGVSKKAFKQALGKLFRERRIAFTAPGIQLLDNSSWSPGN